MLIVTGTIEVGESSVEAAKKAAAAMGPASRAEAGCRAYAFFQDIESPTTFRVYEEWEDQAALTAHFNTPHMAAFNEALKALEVKAANVVKFEPGPASPVL